MPGLPGGGLGPAPFGHMSGMMWGWGGPDGRGGGGHGGGNGGGAKRRRSAAGGGQGGPSGASKGEFYSSSYVNFSKVPVSHKLEILAALEPVKLNPVYMGDAQMAEACRLVKAIQDAPQHVFAYSLSLVFYRWMPSCGLRLANSPTTSWTSATALPSWRRSRWSTADEGNP
jgi:hypothetical protein